MFYLTLLSGKFPRNNKVAAETVCPFTRADRFRGRSYYENFILVCSAPARMNRGTRLMGVYI